MREFYEQKSPKTLAQGQMHLSFFVSNSSVLFLILILFPKILTVCQNWFGVENRRFEIESRF